MSLWRCGPAFKVGGRAFIAAVHKNVWGLCWAKVGGAVGGVAMLGEASKTACKAGGWQALAGLAPVGGLHRTQSLRPALPQSAVLFHPGAGRRNPLAVSS